MQRQMNKKGDAKRNISEEVSYPDDKPNKRGSGCYGALSWIFQGIITYDDKESINILG